MCSWGKRAAHNRAQIIFYLAENLEQRRSEFAACLSLLTGGSEEAGLREVDLSIKRLFHWAAYADKYGGGVQVSEKSAVSALWQASASLAFPEGEGLGGSTPHIESLEFFFNSVFTKILSKPCTHSVINPKFSAGKRWKLYIIFTFCVTFWGIFIPRPAGSFRDPR